MADEKKSIFSRLFGVHHGSDCGCLNIAEIAEVEGQVKENGSGERDGSSCCGPVAKGPISKADKKPR